MAGRLTEHTVLLGGIEHTVLLDQDDVERYGLTEAAAAVADGPGAGEESGEKLAGSPANKARTAANKGR